MRNDGGLDESECFIDATFASAKGGGSEIGPTKRGKSLKIWLISNPAYDRDKLDEELRRDGIETIPPLRRNRG